MTIASFMRFFSAEQIGIYDLDHRADRYSKWLGTHFFNTRSAVGAHLLNMTYQLNEFCIKCNTSDNPFHLQSEKTVILVTFAIIL
jgi:hypothetical protein